MESQDAINNLPLVHTNSSSSLYSSLLLESSGLAPYDIQKSHEFMHNSKRVLDKLEMSKGFHHKWDHSFNTSKLPILPRCL